MRGKERARDGVRERESWGWSEGEKERALGME